MRRIKALAAAALVLVGAQVLAEPATKVLNGPEGRVSITVPEGWREQQISGNIVLRVRAPHGGGHDIIITREAGQDDIDKQRDRYIEYDSGKYAGAEIRKINKPFFGFRLNAPSKNIVLIRRFMRDGEDGLVVASTSRLKMFDEVYATRMMGVLGSISVTGGDAARPEAEGGERRVYDKAAIVSLVAPAIWKTLTVNEDEKEVLALGLKGSRSGPTMILIDMGGPTNANLVLSNIGREWKNSYGSVKFRKFPGKPPRMMCTNRKGGWIDYIVAFEASGHGYALHASMREGGFERYRAIADQVARTVVFTDGGYTVPTKFPGDISEPYRKSFVFHAKVEQTGAIKQVSKHLGRFEKHWGRIGLGKAKKPPPIHIVVAEDDTFAEFSHGFGDKPVAYDRSTGIVVVLPRPKQEDMHPMWRGRLYAALTEAVLHRDMTGRVPPWLRVGLSICMESAGRTTETPETPHPAYVKVLDLKAATDQLTTFADVTKRTNSDFLMAETLANHAMAWGYTHLILYGKSPLSGVYRKWKRAAEKAKRKAPEFDVGTYKRAEEDLKKHVNKELLKQ